MFHFPFLLFGFCLYFLPTIVAIARHKTNLPAILLLNLLLGWSVIGWIVALVWALSADRVAYAYPPWQGQPRQRFCTSCGRSDHGGAHFCPNCGVALT
jgi:hypothetical protein